MSIAPSESFVAQLARDPFTIVFDLEANGLLNDATKIHCLSWQHGDIHGTPAVTRDTTRACEYLRFAKVLVGHNIIRYDIPVLKKLGFNPCAEDVFLLDTLILAQLCYPHLWQIDAVSKKLPQDLWGSHKLKAWGLRLGILKGDYEGGFEEWSQEMQDYNVQDVVVTKALLNHLAECVAPERAVRLEMELAGIVAQMERDGVKFNERKAMDLYAKLETIRSQRLDELQVTFPPKPAVCLGVYGNQVNKAKRLLAERGREITDWADERGWLESQGIKFKWTREVPFNPNSNQQIAERMMALGWIPVDFTETGQPQIKEPQILAMAKQFPEAAPLTDYLLVKKRMEQIANPETKNGWLDHLTPDGRIHGLFNTMGCVSFRFSHSNPNLGQVPRLAKPYGKECRELFEVPEGYLLMGVDASGLELRFLGHYMAPWDKGAFARAAAFGKKEDGTDIHTVNQKAAGLPTRDMAKTFIYAFIYGAGDEKLGRIVNPHCREKKQLIATGKRLRAKFMRATPALKFLIDAVRKKATTQKKLIGLDGRLLRPRSAHSALNLLLQSAGAIAVKEATVLFVRMMRSKGLIQGKDYKMVLHVHDEWQVETPAENADVAAHTAVEAIQLAGQNLNLVVPLDGEAAVGRNWAETH